MQLNRQLVFILTTLSLLIFFEISLNSCASRSAPSGGPKDTLAPVLDTAFPPNMTLNFNEKEVVLVFNEYIQLKSAAQQISFSPPLKNKPTITLKGKELKIGWKEDTLLENTTYIISFGTAIADYTEGNVNEKIKYVFSTGDYIDSLSLSGSVMDISNGEAVEKIMVGLYDLKTIKSKDSIPFNNLPTYYAYTDENGRFSLSNMKYSDFLVVAFEDARGNFKMTTGKEKVAFIKDTISTSLEPEPMKLMAFDPQSPDRLYGARHTDRGQIEVSFNYAPKNLSVEFLDTSFNKEFHFLSLNKEKDTASFWFKKGERDTLALVIMSDSVALDTAIVSLKDFDDASFTLKPKYKEVKFNEPIYIKGSTPIKAIYDSLIYMVSDKDTVEIRNAEIDKNPLLLALKPANRPKQYSLIFEQGAIENIFGKKSDSARFDFSSLAKSDLGNLDFTVKVDSTSPIVLQIFNPAEQKIIDTTFNETIKIKMRYMKAGIYEVRIIVDEDGNGKWTTGSYFDQRQPERIIEYLEKAEVRANWDLDLEWRPNISEPQYAKPKESLSDKN